MIYDIIIKINHILIFFLNIGKEHLAKEDFQDNESEGKERQ